MVDITARTHLLTITQILQSVRDPVIARKTEKKPKLEGVMYFQFLPKEVVVQVTATT